MIASMKITGQTGSRGRLHQTVISSTALSVISETVIAAYRDVGSYRRAAEICGTTHKTVHRTIEAQAASGPSGSATQLCRGF